MPRTSVKDKGVILIQSVLAAVGKAEHSTLGQKIRLTGFELTVEMEGQNYHAAGFAGIMHLNPADLLILICALVNAAAIVSSQEVLHGGGCRQIGVEVCSKICGVGE